MDADSNSLVSKNAGLFDQSLKRQKVQISLLNNVFQYYPNKEDFVVGLVKNKNQEFYTVDIGAPADATLSLFDFEGATKKNRPNLEVGALVYCRLVENNKFLR